MAVKKVKEEALVKAKTIAKHAADKKKAEALAVKRAESLMKYYSECNTN